MVALRALCRIFVRQCLLEVKPGVPSQTPLCTASSVDLVCARASVTLPTAEKKARRRPIMP
jgi:hypothetical protein